MPLHVESFTRQDGQRITLIFFLCRPSSDKVVLSEEHTEYRWFDIKSELESMPFWIKAPIANMTKYGLERA